MTETSGCLNSHPRFLINIGASIFGLEYLTNISVKQEFLKDCRTLFWQSLEVIFFCVLHVQFGWHTVNS